MELALQKTVLEQDFAGYFLLGLIPGVITASGGGGTGAVCFVVNVRVTLCLEMCASSLIVVFVQEVETIAT